MSIDRSIYIFISEYSSIIMAEFSGMNSDDNNELH